MRLSQVSIQYKCLHYLILQSVCVEMARVNDQSSCIPRGSNYSMYLDFDGRANFFLIIVQPSHFTSPAKVNLMEMLGAASKNPSHL